MLVTIGKYQTIESIQQVLKLSKSQIQNIILFLRNHGLLEEKMNGHFIPGSSQIHLSKNSNLVKQHHQNIRLRAIESLNSESYQNNFHYTAISSLSEKDFEII